MDSNDHSSLLEFDVESIDKVLDVVAEVISAIAKRNNVGIEDISKSQLTRFHAKSPPSIKVRDYLARIVKYAEINTTILLSLLVYVDRVIALHPEFILSDFTVHRFIISAVICACKIMGDTYLTNTLYAKIGGISARELNYLELEFLFLIDWKLPVTRNTLQAYYELASKLKA